jgi:pimeloyl-ACP methyl ester carboxylesterase
MKRAMLLLVSVLSAVLLVLTGLVYLWSPGRPDPVVDALGRPVPGAVSEKVFVEINGVRQGMFIRGRDLRNPVLLYLHGGMPEFFLTQSFPTGFEDIFTVVWWEQRGAGISNGDDVRPETINLEQLIQDTHAVTDYVRARFNREKIYLMGHSGGSFLGMIAASRWPELYTAYFGVAQMAFQRESEKLAYDRMLGLCREQGYASLGRRLASVPVAPEGDLPLSYQRIRDEAMHALGVGTMRSMRSVLRGIVIPSWQFRGYSVGEKVRLWRGKLHTGISAVWDSMMKVDLPRMVSEVRIPVYFFHGVHDYTCAFPLSEQYFASIRAPRKIFFRFENSAHSPMLEEPAKMCRILREIVAGGESRESGGETGCHDDRCATES